MAGRAFAESLLNLTLMAAPVVAVQQNASLHLSLGKTRHGPPAPGRRSLERCASHVPARAGADASTNQAGIRRSSTNAYPRSVAFLPTLSPCGGRCVWETGGVAIDSRQLSADCGRWLKAPGFCTASQVYYDSTVTTLGMGRGSQVRGPPNCFHALHAAHIVRAACSSRWSNRRMQSCKLL